MTDRLGHRQTAAMFTLMVLGREVPNPELKELVGFTLTGKERTQLNDSGYVDSEKSGRTFVHQLTDSGWAWCEKELGAKKPPPPRPQSTLCTVLYLVLGGFDDFRRARNLRLADVFGAVVSSAPAEDLESRIRVAYRELVKEPRGWVGLVDLRPKLGAPAAEVDAVLKRLSSEGKVHLVPEDNRKALTAADHEAAIRIGGEDNHLLSIEAL
ncbi:hypothetical protein [Amycolatopsis vancoresmycina]|uniref:Uncharacterized protein n=1 Tax=Amycolatopsis vancoresmycina DSM 44592 TaxID=1292037 RepID=R1FZT7_9PSEU|nr:hypothetical protein [Amycolatopsis vancoresmycina]EOD64802.1 hypothetical protein H480_30091 [Amycolatopsis vancoresmycina DSM 44592]